MTAQFIIEKLTKFTCVNCGLIIQVPTITDDEYCPPDQCPACATGDIHIIRTPLRKVVNNTGMPSWSS